MYVFINLCCTTIDLDLFGGFILAHLFRDKEKALWKLPGTVRSQSEPILNSDFMPFVLTKPMWRSLTCQLLMLYDLNMSKQSMLAKKEADWV